jgi:hypothetical protein
MILVHIYYDARYGMSPNHDNCKSKGGIDQQELEGEARIAYR